MSWRPPPRLLVVGLGRSGIAAARLAVADGAEVWATDRRREGELAESLRQLPEGTRTFLEGHPEEAMEGVGGLVVSPGVAAGTPLITAARGRGLPVWTEAEFAWLHRPDDDLVAVTGSNGKSTVTVLTAEILSASGRHARAGGNLGTPASELVLDGGWDAWVLELSSFQTEILTAMRPRVAVFLNVSEDHLERHRGMAAYLDAKRRLFAFQIESDHAVLNADDPLVAATATRARRHTFSFGGPADATVDEGALLLRGALLMQADELGLTGAHNIANALAASLAASCLGADAGAARSVLRGFLGLEHRHRTVHEAGGVRWIDDSKATNVGATLAALRGYGDGGVRLILGGLGKDQDFAALRDEVARAAAAVYLIGADAERIAGALAGAVRLELCGTLEVAVARARAAAAPGEVVLLAPACASFDQFSGFAERGDRFASLARGEGVA